MLRKTIGQTWGLDPAAPADAPPVAGGVTGGGSPAPQAGNGAGGSPPPATPAGAQSGSAEPRTYGDEDVQRIVRDRLAQEQKKFAPYRELGEPAEIRARLERARRLEEAFGGRTPAEPSPEERELRELLTKQFPGIDKVQSVEDRLAAVESATYARHAAVGRDIIGKLAGEKLGVTDPRALKIVEGAVAASIAEDAEALRAWNSGDAGVVTKHFESVFATGLDPLLKSAATRYASGKAKDMAEVPPSTPKGGVAAPVSGERKLTPEERREAAWEKFQELEGRA